MVESQLHRVPSDLHPGTHRLLPTFMSHTGIKHSRTKTKVKINREMMVPHVNLWLLHACVSVLHTLTSTPTKTHIHMNKGEDDLFPGYSIMGNGSVVDCWPSEHGFNPQHHKDVNEESKTNPRNKVTLTVPET